MGVINEALRDKAPDIPSYAGAANTQYDSGVNSAIMNMLLNRPNESGPLGSRTWGQTGSTNVGGREIPQYGATTTATPGVQGLIDKGLSGTNAVRSQPLSFDEASKQYGEQDLIANRDAVTDAMYRRSTAMMDPKYEQSQEALNTDLANKGFQQGTTGYDRAQQNFTRDKDAAYGDARDRALLAGGQEQSRLFGLNQADRTQDINELMLKRNQPTAELQSAVGLLPGYQNYAQNANIGINEQLKAMTEATNAEQNMYKLENDRSRVSNESANNFTSMLKGGAGGKPSGGGSGGGGF